MKKPAFMDVFFTLWCLSLIVLLFLALLKKEKPDFEIALANVLVSFGLVPQTLRLYREEKKRIFLLVAATFFLMGCYMLLSLVF